ncbi:MAG: carbamoyl-phosphate synthase (glutamine-hydrolyzing) large subunit [Elusimicrobiaceae bacterium]|jgi:carbamoyl-phosphate synthase large subunit|nr:carbamoyl-phosphate synthase (glutamine-hydrolyzing) large subunit [Elusimicrobiaceae bacterium]MBT4007987.1 carbamoyl-phosphate synthase (glutamine-hydrolyzing) large subunit [Elusimicrobiaceae bacterium]MBT4402896.1 carbamoyl-phosphate synthase (glutamine-hydrolyzing) large subunit [Elusimicrobiaceae bacterium]MBT4439475.1 carbamoyl-phosphate synthase (glutamine-hydrolyzing) large subunit [Elusimicrobiaceae bacterium]MBT5987246.1 carbamoyl-phosphate synthase (glutamine-hydrolyzing) large s
MPLHKFLKMKSKKKQKVILLGSGALSIGQAGEFDYSGSQAVKALEEEGLEVIIVNPNIASVQTNKGKNKKVYLYPITPHWIEKVIKKEKPTALVSSFGGQTSLNCVIELDKKGVFKKYGVKVLGTEISTLEMTEDRDMFAKAMRKIDIPIAPSYAVDTVKDALKRADDIGYPVMMRAAFTLGGLGSGFSKNKTEMADNAHAALTKSPQLLIEKDLRGWKEIEYEVMRDASGNSITICNMENMDPMGIHTGDSIVVAPSQTINNQEYQVLRDACIKIVNSLDIVGECNVQFALDPKSLDFFVIEMNARLSRSSALASKATGYPIAYIAAKLVMGFDLLELKNPVTKTTSAFFEPSLDYITVKIPRWDLKKFTGVSKKLGTQMKSVGEVMAIGRNFCETFQKAIRMVNENELGINLEEFENLKKQDLIDELQEPSNLRPFAIYELFKRRMSVDEIYKHTKIEKWFLTNIQRIAHTEVKIKKFFKGVKCPKNPTEQDIYKMFSCVESRYLLHLKKLGFSDMQIVKIALSSALPKKRFGYKEIQKLSLGVRKLRQKLNIVPCIKKIDTTSAEYPTNSNYLYMSYAGTHDDVKIGKNKSIITLGSGSYRIGSSLEFDWCSVMTSKYFKENEKNTDSVIINCNPETVSTDFNSSDRLYFEELTLERVLDILDKETNHKGVIASMGGQNPNNLIMPLDYCGIKILGHSAKTVDKAENRQVFSAILDKLDIDQPRWTSATNMKEVKQFVKEIGFPILIRPSFVLSGTLMNVANDEKSLKYYLSLTKDISKDYPVVLSEFLLDAKEVECDGVAKNGEVVVSIISEHIENAGVHSGDATLLLPAEKLYLRTILQVKDIVKKISKELNLNGPFNIQFIARDNEVKVIECNSRASRSFPFVSKVYDINLAEIACKVMNGDKVEKINIDESDVPWVGIKASMFSFQRLDGADPVLGVEMASTGEVGCLGKNMDEAILLAMQATQVKKPKKGILLSTGREKEKLKFLKVADALLSLGVPIYATKGTCEYMKERGFETGCVHWNRTPRAVDLIKEGKVDFVINIHKSLDLDELAHNAEIRKTAIRCGCSLMTNSEKLITYLKAFTAYDKLYNGDDLINL